MWLSRICIKIYKTLAGASLIPRLLPMPKSGEEPGYEAKRVHRHTHDVPLARIYIPQPPPGKKPVWNPASEHLHYRTSRCVCQQCIVWSESSQLSTYICRKEIDWWLYQPAKIVWKQYCLSARSQSQNLCRIWTLKQLVLCNVWTQCL